MSVASSSRIFANLQRRLTRKPPVEDDTLYSAFASSRLAQRPFLNVGAGKFYHPNWTNVDYGSEWYNRHQAAAFIHYDLTEKVPLPFEDASIELVYTSHTIEHVGADMVQNLFDEAYRVLRPGGGFRVTCPDAALLLRAVRLGKRDYWRWRFPWFSGPLSTVKSADDVPLLDFLVREIATIRSRFYINAVDALDPASVERAAADMSDEAFLDWLTAGVEFRPSSPGDHVCWWSEKKVTAALERAGFKTIWASRWGQSLFSPLTNTDYFDTTQPANSLFLEAIRE